jgi:outer membrane protein OmpA-like peptidoglycan-associated protein
VLFPSNGFALPPEHEAQLQPVLETLEANPGLRVRIEGGSDALGEDAINRQLSTQRAAAVRDYLVAHAKNPQQLAARLSVVGNGETQPLDNNETDAGRARNRYARFIVVEDAPQR